MIIKTVTFVSRPFNLVIVCIFFTNVLFTGHLDILQLTQMYKFQGVNTI